MQFANLGTKKFFAIILIILVALVAEFFILEGSIGISIPSDRYSALSSLEIGSKKSERHFIANNYRFTVVDLLTNHGSNSETLVLREHFFTEREPDLEGPPKATVTVEAMVGGKVRWTFRESGERGDTLTDDLYRVVKLGSGEAGNTYSYFSLADGRKVRTSQNELSREELVALDGSISNK
jgi:hypothetical protein